MSNLFVLIVGHTLGDAKNFLEKQFDELMEKWRWLFFKKRKDLIGNIFIFFWSKKEDNKVEQIRLIHAHARMIYKELHVE